MPIDTQILISELKAEEGCKLTAYFDTKSILTIGWGHNLHEPISQTAADLILTNDVSDTVADIVSRLPFVVNLDPVRQSVFLDMCYNMGIESLLEFHDMISAARINAWTSASIAGLNSKWAKVDVPDRAKILMQRLLTGVL